MNHGNKADKRVSENTVPLLVKMFYNLMLDNSGSAGSFSAFRWFAQRKVSEIFIILYSSVNCAFSRN